MLTTQPQPAGPGARRGISRDGCLPVSVLSPVWMTWAVLGCRPPSEDESQPERATKTSTGEGLGGTLQTSPSQGCRGWVFYGTRLSCCSCSGPLSVLSRTGSSRWHRGPLTHLPLPPPHPACRCLWAQGHPLPRTHAPAALATRSSRNSSNDNDHPVCRLLLPSQNPVAGRCRSRLLRGSCPTWNLGLAAPMHDTGCSFLEGLPHGRCPSMLQTKLNVSSPPWSPPGFPLGSSHTSFLRCPGNTVLAQAMLLGSRGSCPQHLETPEGKHRSS